MEQLLKRLKFFFKSQIQKNETLKFEGTFDIDDDSDAELKRIIDELASSETRLKEPKSAKMTLAKAYYILGLKSNPTIEEIKIAYKKRLKEYHPDLVANLGEELQILAQKKTQEVISAYQFLKMYHNF